MNSIKSSKNSTNTFFHKIEFSSSSRHTRDGKSIKHAVDSLWVYFKYRACSTLSKAQFVRDWEWFEWMKHTSSKLQPRRVITRKFEFFERTKVLRQRIFVVQEIFAVLFASWFSLSLTLVLSLSSNHVIDGVIKMVNLKMIKF